MIAGKGWPIAGGAWLIPPNTLIDSTTWTNLPTPMPLDCIAQDTASAQQMLVWWSVDYGRLWPQIVFAPGVNRSSVMAAAAAAIGWNSYPNKPYT
jgi:hypothetical protein